MRVLIPYYRRHLCLQSFPDNSIQLNLISLSQFHNPQEGILSSWSLVGSVQSTTEEEKSECWFPKRKALEAGRAGCFISKGLPRWLDLRSLRQGKEAGVAVVVPKSHVSHERWQGGAQGCLIWVQLIFSGRMARGAGYWFLSLRVQSACPRWWMDCGEKAGPAGDILGLRCHPWLQVQFCHSPSLAPPTPAPPVR